MGTALAAAPRRSVAAKEPRSRFSAASGCFPAAAAAACSSWVTPCRTRRLRTTAPGPGSAWYGGLSVRGFHVQVTVQGTFQDPPGWFDLALGRLQDGVPGWCCPGREGLAEIAVIGILGRDRQALPGGQLAGERAPLDGQVLDPLARLRDLL